jgi:hypothetical protein
MINTLAGSIQVSQLLTPPCVPPAIDEVSLAVAGKFLSTKFQGAIVRGGAPATGAARVRGAVSARGAPRPAALRGEERGGGERPRGWVPATDTYAAARPPAPQPSLALPRPRAGRPRRGALRSGPRPRPSRPPDLDIPRRPPPLAAPQAYDILKGRIGVRFFMDEMSLLV